MKLTCGHNVTFGQYYYSDDVGYQDDYDDYDDYDDDDNQDDDDDDDNQDDDDNDDDDRVMMMTMMIMTMMMTIRLMMTDDNDDDDYVKIKYDMSNYFQAPTFNSVLQLSHHFVRSHFTSGNILRHSCSCGCLLGRQCACYQTIFKERKRKVRLRYPPL